MQVESEVVGGATFGCGTAERDGAADLTEASLGALLLYGLTLDDEDPALGVLRGARRELGLLAGLAERVAPGAAVDLPDLVPVLESISRRIDVAVELLRRAERCDPKRTVVEGGAHASKG